MNFHPLGCCAMSSDETPKIEPTLTDAPSIAPEAKSEAAETAPKVEAVQTEAPKADAPTIEAKVEPEKIEPKLDLPSEQNPQPKIEPKIEVPTLPPAAQLAESAAI